MLAEIPTEQFAATIEEVARAVLAEVDWTRPPVDMLAVAERLNLLVARDASMDVRARFVRLSEPTRTRQGTILLADDPRAERQQWAVAHEVGESIAHRVFVRLGVAIADLPKSGREAVANHLANCLLLPRDWFAADGEAVGWDLLQLKRIYATASHELIARRMLEMSPRVIVTLFDQGACQWRRSNALGRPPQMTTPEKNVWRSCFESGQQTEYDESQLPEGVQSVRCWPVHEPGWRREIMRTELVDW